MYYSANFAELSTQRNRTCGGDNMKIKKIRIKPKDKTRENEWR